MSSNVPPPPPPPPGRPAPGSPAVGAPAPGNPAPTAPPVRPVPVAPPEEQGDATGGVIPYKNPHALAAYYTAIGALLIPGLGIVALILGIKGLRARKAKPIIKGSVHAWIGIVVGALTTLAWGTCIGGAIVGFVMSGSRSSSGSPGPMQPAPYSSPD